MVRAMRRLLALALVLVVGLAGVGLAGCGSSASSSSTGSSAPTATTNPAAEERAQHRAEAIYERQGISFYVGVIRPSTVRFSHPCPPAKEGEEGHEKPVPGKWRCAGWGLISIEGGGGKPGECEFVEGDVTANGVVGKPEGSAMTFSSSPCQLNLGLGSPGKRPKASLVASWAAKQGAEKRHVQEQEATPEAHAQKREEAKEEQEEARRTEEARKTERGE
jgi:hypothetical protein